MKKNLIFAMALFSVVLMASMTFASAGLFSRAEVSYSPASLKVENE